MQKLRDELLRQKVIEMEGAKLKFKIDYLFSSPSAAAAIVMGRSANGLTEWKLKNGKILKVVESNK